MRQCYNVIVVPNHLVPIGKTRRTENGPVVSALQRKRKVQVAMHWLLFKNSQEPYLAEMEICGAQDS